MSERVEAAEQAQRDREKHDKLLNRVVADPALRTRLKQQPKQVLHEAGIEVPPDVEVTVVDFDPKHRYLFLPPTP